MCAEPGRGGSALSVRKTPLGPCGQQTGAGETGAGRPQERDEDVIQGWGAGVSLGIFLISPGCTDPAMGSSKTLSWGHWGAAGGP